MIMKHFVVGLTGPIGAGKSYVAAILKEKGLFCIDTDQVSRQVVMPGTPCLRELADEFGEDIMENGVLNRQKLASVAFATERGKQALNRITHPYITEETIRQIDQLPEGQVAVVEATLLFDSPLEPLCDTILAVVADDTIRLQRVMQRDNADIASIRLRMRAQPSCEDYQKRANDVLVNNGDIDLLREQTIQWIGRLKEVCQ